MLRNVLWCLILGLAFLGCSTGEKSESERVVVYAASSLTDALSVLEKRFETIYPQIDIATAFAGSQTLRLQIQQGAPADIFISANPEHMADLVTQGRVIDTRVFAHNRLAVVVPKTNSSGLRVPSDLVHAQRLVIGSAEVPIGKYTREWLLKMDESTGNSFSKNVLSKVVSQENNVRLLRAKVELDEADAAIVYVTDALSSSHVNHLPIDANTNIRTTYQLGVVSNRKRHAALDTWRNFLNSDEARGLMKEQGLGLP